MKPDKLRSKKIKHPRFVRPNVGRPDRRRLKDTWRKPRGIDNKQREKQVKMGALPNIGYRNPKSLRGLHPSGYSEVLVRCLADLQGLDKGTIAVRIASSVGKKKRAQIVDEANKMGLKLLN